MCPYHLHHHSDLNSIEDAFNTALTLQGGFFDTAEVYARGESEKILGACIAALPEEERSKVIVATKASHARGLSPGCLVADLPCKSRFCLSRTRCIGPSSEQASSTLLGRA